MGAKVGFDLFSSKANLKEAVDLAYQELDQIKFTLYPLAPYWQPSFYAIRRNKEQYVDSLSKILQAGLYEPSNADYLYGDKENHDYRPIAVLTNTDRILYQALMNKNILGGVIDKKLHDFVYNNRLDFGNALYCKKYKQQWRKYLDAQIASFESGYTHLARFDIKAFFESIVHAKLFEILENDIEYSDARVTALLKKQLEVWDKNKHGIGVPQGLIASYVLANAYLHPFDKYVNELTHSNDTVFFRWCDDMILMAKSEKQLKEQLSLLVLKLREYNLLINHKTQIRELHDASFIEEQYFASGGADGHAINSNTKQEARLEMPAIISELDTDSDKASLSKKQIRLLRYFIKSADVRDEDFLDSMLRIAPKVNSFVAHLCRYFSVFVDYERVYLRLYDIYKNSHLSDYSKYWYFRLLLDSVHSKNDIEFNKYVDSLVADAKDPYLLFLILTNRESQHFFTSDKLKYILSIIDSPLLRANYLTYSIDLDGENLPSLMQEILLSGSIDEQMIILDKLNVQEAAEDKVASLSLSPFGKAFFHQAIDGQKEGVSQEKTDSDYEVITIIAKDIKDVKRASTGRYTMNALKDKSRAGQKNLVKSIEWLKINDNSYKIIINHNYNQPIRCRITDRPKWEGAIYRLLSNSKNLLIEYDKSTFDYVNSNKSWRVRKELSLETQTILQEHKKIHMSISSDITVEEITEKKLKQRQNKDVAA